MIEVKALSEDRWRDFRDIRLEALKKEPLAFGSSWEEENNLSEEEWKRRIKNTTFAIEQDRLVGIMVWVPVRQIKGKHVANIYSVYVTEPYRQKGVARQLMEAVLAQIKENRDIIKIELAVNTVQEAAVSFYRKSGFKIIGRSNKALFYNGRYYDELLMEKFL